MERQVELLYNPLLLYVNKRVNNREDAKDLTQEVFYKLSKSELGEVKSIKSWVFTIAKNTITDYYRMKKPIISEIEEVADIQDEEESVASELSECVRQFVDELPQEYRTIMIMSELKEIPQKEIALQLNMNYATVRSKVQRGRKILKKLISDCCVVVQGGKGSIIEYKQNKKCDDDC